MEIETFCMVHPEYPDCVGDAATLAVWSSNGWERKDAAKADHEVDKKADNKSKAK